MQLKLYLICFFLFSFIPFKGYVQQTQTKLVYCYDPALDMAVNIPVANVAYGSPLWSYETNNRSNNEQRAARFFPQDIIGCSLMDFGCNEGGVLLACKKLGAKEIIGIDYNAWCIEQARWKALQNGLTDTHFLVGDMETKALYAQLPDVDTVFLLAILDTSNFSSKQAILSQVARHAKKALYYEGHVSLESHVKRFYELFLLTDFTRFELLGRFDGRLLIRCSRELITEKELPAGAITSDCPDPILIHANEIYIYTDCPRNPAFSVNCRVIQFVKRGE